MLAGYLLQAIERQSDTLADALVRDLTTNDRTPSFRRLPADELKARAQSIYGRIADWLGGGTDAETEATFEALGRQRFEEAIPLEELVFALLLTKAHLQQRVASPGEVASAIELHYENDLHAMIGRFFDRAVHATVRGYEEARRAPPAPQPPRQAWARFDFETSANVGAWMP
jgi:hypothetical protein